MCLCLPEIDDAARSRGLFLARRVAFNDSHDVGLLHDQELLAVDLDLGASPLSEQDTLARLEFDRRKFASLVACAGSDRNDLALLRLLLDGIGNYDSAFRLLLALNSADDDAVVQWTEFHEGSFPASRSRVGGERLLSPTFRSTAVTYRGC